MGMTKALMEKQVQAHARRFDEKGPIVCCVRYGNVLYSRGSVVPLFVEKLLRDEPLPVTHPDMTRFLMPLSQAVGLVEMALAHGRQGDLFIRKSPAATVATLVQAVGRLLGKTAVTQPIGVRHGEKMHETLATSEEMAKALDLGEHWRIPMDARELNYAPLQEVAQGAVASTLPFASDTARQLDVDETVEMLRALPEMHDLLRQAGSVRV
jgi:UDP-glucose 4-epimerase